MDFDFLQVSLIDIQGQERTKTVPRSRITSASEHGVPFYCGVQATSLHTCFVIFEELKTQNMGNGFAKLDLNTLCKKPWLSKEFTIGHVMADMHWPNMETNELVPQETCSRILTKTAVQSLQEIGYSLYSAFEYEFQVLDAATEQHMIVGTDPFIDLHLSPKFRQFMHRAVHYLEEMGVEVEYFNREYAFSQFEVPLFPKFGIASADKAVRFKSTMKELAQDEGYLITFMTRPFSNDAAANGGHFNFSLWDSDSKRNILYDPHGKYKLSQVGRHWLGGIMTHLPALIAICSPTVNCYRRLNRAWTPTKLYWNVDDRNATIRVKTNSEENCYFENRLCSAAVNPYTVLAATIYAGIDGVQKQLEPPEPGEFLREVPHNLNEALDLLQQDSYMMEKLGKHVEWLITLKRKFEVEKFQHHDLTTFNEDEMKKEREEYLRYC